MSNHEDPTTDKECEPHDEQVDLELRLLYALAHASEDAVEEIREASRHKPLPESSLWHLLDAWDLARAPASDDNPITQLAKASAGPHGDPVPPILFAVASAAAASTFASAIQCGLIQGLHRTIGETLEVAARFGAPAETFLAVTAESARRYLVARRSDPITLHLLTTEADEAQGESKTETIDTIVAEMRAKAPPPPPLSSNRLALHRAQLLIDNLNRASEALASERLETANAARAMVDRFWGVRQSGRRPIWGDLLNAIDVQASLGEPAEGFPIMLHDLIAMCPEWASRVDPTLFQRAAAAWIERKGGNPRREGKWDLALQVLRAIGAADESDTPKALHTYWKEHVRPLGSAALTVSPDPPGRVDPPG